MGCTEEDPCAQGIIPLIPPQASRDSSSSNPKINCELDARNWLLDAVRCTPAAAGWMPAAENWMLSMLGEGFETLGPGCQMLSSQ